MQGAAHTRSSVSGVTIPITPPTSGNLVITTEEETSGTVNIPSNAVWAKIENAGTVKPGDVGGDITVGGVVWTVGRKEEWNASWDQINNVYKFIPATAIVTTGSRIRVTYAV